MKKPDPIAGVIDCWITLEEEKGDVIFSQLVCKRKAAHFSACNKYLSVGLGAILIKTLFSIWVFATDFNLRRKYLKSETSCQAGP